MTASSNCKVVIEELTSIKLTARLDIEVTSFYSDIGETAFIDRLAALLGIHPSRVKVVGVRQGSAIVESIILPKSISNNQDPNEAKDKADLEAVL